MVKIGDYFVRSWGYDQTNVNYYKVVGITPSGKSVKLAEVNQITVADRGYAVDVKPGDEVIGETVTKRLHGPSRWDEGSVTWNSYSNAYLWDGKSNYQTGSGFGH